MTVIALTGIPGTGKTTIAELLEPEIPIRDVNELAQAVDAIEGHDERRAADIVNEDTLWDRAREELPDGPVLVEGALAHHCNPDTVLLLRCHPDELRQRLAQRDWPESKIEENVMAETLDALVPEINVAQAWEIDTTGKQPKAIAELIRAMLDGEDPSLLFDSLGSADWTHTIEGGPPG